MTNTPSFQAKRVFVIADDLTGAADSAYGFTRPGRHARVSIDQSAPWDHSSDAPFVQVYDAESRNLNPNEVSTTVRSAAAQITDVEARVYKKVDSTLRGHVGLEIETMLSALGRRLAVLAPAFPENGRVVRNGQLYIAGQPASVSALPDDVVALLRRETTLPVGHIDLKTIRAGAPAIRRALAQLPFASGIAVADADCDDDLWAVAEAIADAPDVLPCGSAGLALALANRWMGDASSPATSDAAALAQPTRSLNRCSRVLVVVGSMNPISHSQFAEMVETRPDVRVVLASAALLANPKTRAAEMDRGSANLLRHSDALVHAIKLVGDCVSADGREVVDLAAHLATLVTRWLGGRASTANDAPGLVVTGGETAVALCRAMGVAALYPQGAVLPGIPWSLIEVAGRQVPLISKAGGFGGPSALAIAVASLFDNSETSGHSLT